MKQPLVSIVGAGPGDPELLTIKAFNRIVQADAILYDALMGNEILRHAKPGTELVYVGKLYHDGQNQTERQDAIHAQILKLCRAQKHVVRLKAGDPMMFGRGAEEVGFCLENGLEVEVIPGITAGLAAAALFQVPLTLRGKSSMCLFYTGQLQDGSFPDLDPLVAVLQTGSPVVLYMGLSAIDVLSGELINRGISANMPIQLLSRVSQAEQQGLSAKLGDVGELLRKNKLPMPTVILIGEYVQRIVK